VQTGGGRPGASEAGVADRRVAWRLALLFFLLFALFHRGHFSGTDEVGLFQVTASLYSHGSLAVPDFVHTAEGTDGRRYSHFSVGVSALALPFYAVGRLASALLPEGAQAALAGPRLPGERGPSGGRVEVFAVGLYAPSGTALLVALFFLFQRRLGVSRGTAVACAALFGASSYVAIHATFFLRHVSECLCIVGALYFYLAWKQDGRQRDLWLGSILAAAIPVVRLPASIAGPILGGYLGWCLFERSGRRFDPVVLHSALPAVLVPLALGLGLSALSDYLRWGVPWNLHQLGTASAGSTPLHVSLYGALLSPGMSVFVYSPLLLLTPWTFPQLWRRQRAEAVTFAAMCLCFLLVFSSFIGWTGLWSAPGPRYQLIATPLLLLPLGLWLDAMPGRRRWGAALCLAAVGLLVQLALMSVVWGGLVDFMAWKQVTPKWSFLLVPEQSPPYGALRYLASERMLPDLWLLRLARGWPGQPPAPAAALAVFGVWCALLAAASASLWRALQDARAQVSPPATRQPPA